MKLVLKDISKKYKDKIALNNINIEFDEGIYGLLGANGSGKTTLMKIITDVSKQTYGEIFLNGSNKEELKEKYRDLIGYLPQEIVFYDFYTPEKFLNYIGELKGVDKDILDKKIEELIELVGLSDVRKKKIKKLSGGMKRRLGIAQALLNDPKILILDEPTVGLDPKERIKFRNIISALGKDRIVILSTHIVSDVEDISDKIIIMKDGEIIENSTADKLIKNVSEKCFIISVDNKKFKFLEENYEIVNVNQSGGKLIVKFLSDTKPLEGAKLYEPTLEEVYLYHFGENKKALFNSTYILKTN